MTFYRSLVRPLLFRCDPERAHDASLRAAELVGAIPWARRMLSGMFTVDDPRLVTEIAGIRFPNPVGLAAGYDKSGRVIDFMASLGFGYVEIGSVSAEPSTGNPGPRLWRLPSERAIVVNYGLPNDGAEAVARRLSCRPQSVPLGINIAKTNHGPDALPEDDDAILSDYRRSIATFDSLGDYLCLNLSCPNTRTGRDFFTEPDKLPMLLAILDELNVTRPVFLKISPLGGVAAIERLLEVVEPYRRVSGFIFNLPPGIPEELSGLTTLRGNMTGAVAGAPARKSSNLALSELYRRMDRKRYRIIAAGGIFNAEDAYEKIRLGASAVQLLTALIYEGPGVVARINRGLCHLLSRDGFRHLGEAVGTAQDLG